TLSPGLGGAGGMTMSGVGFACSLPLATAGPAGNVTWDGKTTGSAPEAGAGCAATWTSVTPGNPTRPRASLAMWIRRTAIPPFPGVRGQKSGVIEIDFPDP